MAYLKRRIDMIWESRIEISRARRYIKRAFQLCYQRET